MTLAIRQGQALHRIMEFTHLMSTEGTAGEHPVLEPVWQRCLAPFGLNEGQARDVWDRAQALLALPLARRLLGARGERAWIEREWPDAHGQICRPDRVVVDAIADRTLLRVIDFKWRLLDSERQPYAEQLARYLEVMEMHSPTAHQEAFILTAEPSIWQLIDGRLIHCDEAGRPAL